nr:uncharacterized protein CI109_006314 [Kwoniella shandongensis]KAA5525335.1 hypothetical protein CI109_006314 [Kwoniella shandongensis]
MSTQSQGSSRSGDTFKAYLTATFDMSSGVSKKESMKAAMSKVTYETGSAAPSSTGSSGTKTYGPDSLTGVLTEGIEGVVEDDDFEEHGQFLLEEFEKEYQNKLGKAYDHIQKAHCTAQGSRAG